MFLPVTERGVRMKKSSLVILSSVVLSFVGYLMEKNSSSAIGEFLLVIPVLVGLPIGLSMSKKEKRKEYNALSEEERAKKDAEKEQKLAEAQERLERWKLESTIVSTAIVSGTTIGKQKSSVTSSFVRGAVGGAVFGPVGMIAGAVTPKKKIVTKGGTVTFSILYAAGNRSVETVKVGSKRYNELARYLA